MVTLVQEDKIKLRHKANIFGMYVSPEMRGSGIGKALLLEVIEKAKSIKEIEKLILTVVSTNKQAIKLYSHLGFNVFGKEEKALKINGRYFDEEYMDLNLR